MTNWLDAILISIIKGYVVGMADHNGVLRVNALAAQQGQAGLITPDAENAYGLAESASGVKMAYVKGAAVYGEETYPAALYGFHAGESYIALVFRLNEKDPAAQSKMESIVNSLTENPQRVNIPLGSTGYALNLAPDFQKVDDGLNTGVADSFRAEYYASDSTRLTFDIYQFPAELIDQLDALADLSSQYFQDVFGDLIEEFNTEIADTDIIIPDDEDPYGIITSASGVKIAYMNGVSPWLGRNYPTALYTFKAGDSYVVLVFWLSGNSEYARSEAKSIISTLSSSK